MPLDDLSQFYGCFGETVKIGIIAPYNVLSLSEGASIRVFELAKGLNACGASVYVLHHGSTKSFSFNFKFINFKSYNFLFVVVIILHPVNPFCSTRLCRRPLIQKICIAKNCFWLKNMILHTCFDVD